MIFYPPVILVIVAIISSVYVTSLLLARLKEMPRAVPAPRPHSDTAERMLAEPLDDRSDSRQGGVESD